MMPATCVMSGNEDALKVLVQRKEALSNADSRGWIPLHEAAVQHKKSILEITYAGPWDKNSFGSLFSATGQDVEFIIHNSGEKGRVWY